MGWKKGRKGQSKQNKKTDGKANNPDNSGWKNDTRREIVIVKENARFEEFYRTQDCFDNSEMDYSLTFNIECFGYWLCLVKMYNLTRLRNPETFSYFTLNKFSLQY